MFYFQAGVVIKALHVLELPYVTQLRREKSLQVAHVFIPTIFQKVLESHPSDDT